MLDVPAANLRNVNKSVLVYSDINENAEIDNIADSSHKLHAGLEILDLHNIAASEERRRKFVTEVAAGFFEFADDVGKGRNADPEAAADIVESERISLFGNSACSAV